MRPMSVIWWEDGYDGKQTDFAVAFGNGVYQYDNGIYDRFRCFSCKKEVEDCSDDSGKQAFTSVTVHDISETNAYDLAIQDEAKLHTNVIADKGEKLSVECDKRPNVYILGVQWTAKRK